MIGVILKDRFLSKAVFDRYFCSILFFLGRDHIYEFGSGGFVIEFLHTLGSEINKTGYFGE